MGSKAPRFPWRFYIHAGPALDHSWLTCAEGHDALMQSAHYRFMAEQGLHNALARHPRRTREPRHALLFFIAIYEYTSLKLDAIRALRGRLLATREHEPLCAAA